MPPLVRKGEPPVVDDMVQYLERRKADAKRLFQATLSLGLRIMVIGLLLVSASVVLMGKAEAAWVLQVSHVLGNLCISLGLVIASTCPPSEVDIDALVLTIPKSRLLMACAAGMLSLWESYTQPPHFAAAFTALLAAVGGIQKLCDVCRVQATSMTSQYVGFRMLADACASMWTHTHKETSELALWEAVINTVGFIVLETGWLHNHWRWRSRQGKRGLGPTASCYGALYVYFVTMGLRGTTQGLHRIPSGDTDGQGVVDLLNGIGCALPPLLVVVLGHKRVFGFLARRFDSNRQRALQDAAYTAYILASHSLSVGDVWWHLRGSGNVNGNGDTNCQNRQWHPGKVVSMDHETMTVAFPNSDGSNDLHDVSLESNNLSCKELLLDAQRSLRCLEWHNFTLDLLKSGPICGADDQALRGNAYFESSRHVSDGEVIDFFVSHSWTDDATAKYEQLEKVVSGFERVHRRTPTFWFDKVCIDQGRIANGLRSLPLYIMSCKHVLVLCGPSFPTRLWCAWELFVVTTFVQSEEALLDRIVFRSLGTSDTCAEDPLALVQKFDVRATHCFDPNDEARLRRVITSLGEDVFNRRVRSLGQCMAQNSWTFVRRSANCDVV